MKFKLRNKKDDFKWVWVAVYGAAQPIFKEKSLTKVVQACNKKKLPIMMGGGGGVCGF